MSEQDNIQFKLVNIQIVSKVLNAMPENFPLVYDGFRFEVKVEDKVQAANEFVLVFVHSKISNEDRTMTFGDLSVAYFFHILKFNEFIKLEESGTYTIPPYLDALIRPVCISTTRGIIYSEFRGTFLHNAIMPVIMMTDMKPDVQPETIDETKVNVMEKDS